MTNDLRFRLSDDDAAAAAGFVEAMRDGEDGPVLGRSLQGLEDLGFCERIEDRSWLWPREKSSGRKGVSRP